MIAQLLERLAEMFPKQDYGTRLEAYLKEKGATSIADVENLIREYSYTNSQHGGL